MHGMFLEEINVHHGYIPLIKMMKKFRTSNNTNIGPETLLIF